MGNTVDGVFLLDKPEGLTSNQALQRVKRLFRASKAGHTGTLDPLATGVLPICLGEATKFSGIALDAEKIYEATVQFGVRTSTGDREGDILETMAAVFTRDDLQRELGRLGGRILQTPPMYSALKHNGKPLYRYARKGIEIERRPREVEIREFTMLWHHGDRASLRIKCSKGTYIRVLAETLGERLGCGGHLVALRRLGAGPALVEHCTSMSDLEALEESSREALLRPVDYLVSDLPGRAVDRDAVTALLCGRTVPDPGASGSGVVRLIAPDGQFIGLGEVRGDGILAPRRMMSGSATGGRGCAQN